MRDAGRQPFLYLTPDGAVRLIHAIEAGIRRAAPELLAQVGRDPREPAESFKAAFAARDERTF